MDISCHSNGHIPERKSANSARRGIGIGQAKSIKVPDEFHRLEHPPQLPLRVQPQFHENVNELWCVPDQDVADAAIIKDVSWDIARIQDTECNVIPAWTGFYQVTTKDDHQDICSTGYFAFINAQAHDNDTLWTVMMRCVKISNIMNPGQSTVITFDQQLYCKAKELQFMQAIGQHFTDSGLPEVWIESAVFGENTASKI